MIRAFTPSFRPMLCRSAVFALFAVIAAGAACDNTDPTDPMESSAPSELPAAEATADTAAVALADPLAPAFASVSYSGLPYGPIGLWSSNTSVSWGPAPFTGTQNYTDPNGIVTQINSARSKRQRLILAMTGGPSTRYTTNGKFDMAKWKNRMNSYKTATIRNAVAAAVADGTIIGNQLIDEPETPRWGGNVSKSTIDQMATYAKDIFPTLPMGINLGPPGYKWRTGERFRVLDYVIYQYNHYITSGNISAWRESVLDRARADGVTPAFSLNLLNGGVQDRRGSWDCQGTGGKGTRFPNCRMTASQVRDWGRAIGVAGCAMQMWRYDGAFMSKSANQDAFRDVASLLASKSRRSCKRP
jgi:hypothetical protein